VSQSKLTEDNSRYGFINICKKKRQNKYENPRFKEDEEQLRLNFTKQVKEEENRFRQWESQVQRKI
jgi:septin family protein